jgi:hypothetical protein
MIGKNTCEINVFLQNMCCTIIVTPRNDYESNLTDVYSYSYFPFLSSPERLGTLKW